MRDLNISADRQMPQSPDAERTVLGAILINNKAFARVVHIVTADDFSKDAHRLAFAAFQRMISAGCDDLDAITLRDDLQRHGELDRAGGVAYISGLTDAIPDIARVELYARIVKEKSQLREVITIGSSMMQRAFAEEGEAADEITAWAAGQMERIRPPDAEKAVLCIRDMIQPLEVLYVNGGLQRGAATGWTSLDRYYTIARSAFTLITGIPGHGKSNFIDALAINVARRHDWQVAMFSAENYPPESHLASLIEKHVGMPFNEGQTARMQPQDICRGASFIDSHIRIMNPVAEMTIDRVLSTATALSETRRIDLLTIDPWNELTHRRRDGQNETEYVNQSLSKIRRWVRKHDAHVMLVAHPAKMQKEKQSGKYPVPTPYDISGSAHWRNQSDYCLTVFRDTTEGDDDSEVQIHIQKARRREIGSLGLALLKYDKVTGEYSDPATPRKRYEYE